jgi:hypothetical protein
MRIAIRDQRLFLNFKLNEVPAELLNGVRVTATDYCVFLVPDAEGPKGSANQNEHVFTLQKIEDRDKLPTKVEAIETEIIKLEEKRWCVIYDQAKMPKITDLVDETDVVAPSLLSGFGVIKDAASLLNDLVSENPEEVSLEIVEGRLKVKLELS